MVSSLSASMAYEIALPGCIDVCGGVKIPYPFGIGDGCYYTNSSLYIVDTFKINCDRSTNPPYPFIVTSTTNLEVLSISLEDVTIRVSSGVEYNCYHNGELVATSSPIWKALSFFIGLDFSYGRNKIVGVGWDTQVAVSGFFGCNTSCTNVKVMKNGTCDSNYGCCEVLITAGTNWPPTVQLNGSSRHYQGCKYAFVSEVGWYNFSTNDLMATPTDCAKIRAPVLFSWCEFTPICDSNAYATFIQLYDSHQCECIEGYTGNPYLPRGCQDIDECGDERLNDCREPEICVNKIGGFVCQFPDGHHGNDNEVAKTGCQGECSGVKIPFPFGIGEGCFAKAMPEFEIICDPRNPKPRLQLLGNKDVLNINIEDHTLQLSVGVAYQCYTNGQPVPSAINTSTYSLDVMYPFDISATVNKFVAIGCVATARLSSIFSDGVEDVSVCTTDCADFQSVRLHRGICDPPLGCCETSISSNLLDASIYVDNKLSDVNTHNTSCVYTFIGEVGSYKFSESNMTFQPNDCQNIRFPVLYDWHVSTLYNSCSEAKIDGNGSYNPRTLCRSNSQIECIDEDVNGYRCHCLKGYNGNPYHPHGCQDINECLNEELNTCQRADLCVNMDGGYRCECPKGHHGNGTTTSPCIPNPGADHNLILGLSMGMCSTIGLILLYGIYKLVRRRKDVKDRKHNFKKNGGLLLQQEMHSNEGAIDRTKIFSRSDLEKATDNFNDNRVLGSGGQGTVYKGMLSDGTIVAVKKSKKVGEIHLAQFINEVVILSQINHRNVVKIFGCCLETEVPLLVYEFVQNGTLYQHIHHPSEDFQLTWKVRFQIAMECAGAVAYLHSSCSSPIYHRDIKSSNILLDDKYKAKISDFGTSRSISIDKTHVTTCVQGTFGYLDPEFFRSSQFTEKSDVYSFGVVLLELLTRKKPIFTDMSSEPRSLATEFVYLRENSPTQLQSFLDTEVLEQSSEEEIEAMAKLIEQCLSLYGKQRPSMREVTMALEMIKSEHGKEENPINAEEIRRQEACVWNEEMMGITDEHPLMEYSCSNDSSYSTNLQSFDCN